MEQMKFNVEMTINMTKEENGKFSCYVPETDCYFGAADVEQAKKKAKIISMFVIKHFVEENKKGR